MKKSIIFAVLLISVMLLSLASAFWPFDWTKLKFTGMPVQEMPSLSDGVVAYWTFNEPVNSADPIINEALFLGIETPIPIRAADGVRKGGQTNVKEGIYNTAGYFDGVDDSIEVPALDALDLQQFSVSVWVKSKKASQNGGIVEKTIDGGVNAQWLLYTQGESYYFRIKSAKGALMETINLTWLNKDVWVHLVGTYDGDEMKLYRNGVIVNSKSITDSIVTGNGQLFMGRLRGGIYPFNGSIDEVVIYNRALSNTEVSALYNTQKEFLGKDSQTNTGNCQGIYITPRSCAYNATAVNVSVENDGRIGTALKGLRFQFILQGDPRANVIIETLNPTVRISPLDMPAAGETKTYSISSWGGGLNFDDIPYNKPANVRIWGQVAGSKMVLGKAEPFACKVSASIQCEAMPTQIVSEIEENLVLPAPNEVRIAAASSHEINIEWEDNSMLEEGFRIYRANISAGPYILLAQLPINTNSYSDSQLNAETNYYYKVRAFNGSVESQDSEIAEGNTGSSSLPVLDITPPIVTQKHPEELIITRVFTLNITTDELAICKISSQDEEYAQMPYFLSETKSLNHVREISIGNNTGRVKYYIRCIDESGNINVHASEVVFYYDIPYTDTNIASTVDEFIYIEDNDACKDSDGGILYKNKGTVSVYERKWWTLWLTGEYKNYSDTCSTDNSIIEYFCDDNSKGERKLSCNCKEGVCLRECTEADWVFNLNPATCPANGQQTKTWTKVGECSGGVSKLASEIIPCAVSSGKKGSVSLLDAAYDFTRPMTLVYPGGSYPTVLPTIQSMHSQARQAVYLQDLYWIAKDVGYYAHCWLGSPVSQSATGVTQYTPRGSSSVVYIDVSKLPGECAQADQLEIEYELQGAGLAELNASPSRDIVAQEGGFQYVGEPKQTHSCRQPLASAESVSIFQSTYTLHTPFNVQKILVPSREDGGISKGSFSVPVNDGREITLVDQTTKYYAPRVVYLEAYRPFEDYNTPPRINLTLKNPQCTIPLELANVNPLVDFDACKQAGKYCAILVRKDSSTEQIVPIASLKDIFAWTSGGINMINNRVTFFDNGALIRPQNSLSNFREFYFLAENSILPVKLQIDISTASSYDVSAYGDKAVFSTQEALYVVNLTNGFILKQFTNPLSRTFQEYVEEVVDINDNGILYSVQTTGMTPSVREHRYYEYNILSGINTLLFTFPEVNYWEPKAIKNNRIVFFGGDNAAKKGILVYDIASKQAIREVTGDKFFKGRIYVDKNSGTIAFTAPIAGALEVHFYDLTKNEYKTMPSEIAKEISFIYGIEGDTIFVEKSKESLKFYAYNFTANTLNLVYDYETLSVAEKKIVIYFGGMSYMGGWKNLNYLKSAPGQQPYMAYYLVNSSAQTNIENPLGLIINPK
ncbi:MAG: LamG-like jellyroll fold domain-containing protein [Nanoarchaeota archaeon]